MFCKYSFLLFFHFQLNQGSLTFFFGINIYLIYWYLVALEDRNFWSFKFQRCKYWCSATRFPTTFVLLVLFNNSWTTSVCPFCIAVSKAVSRQNYSYIASIVQKYKVKHLEVLTWIDSLKSCLIKRCPVLWRVAGKTRIFRAVIQK